jgi:hypothetical protein
MSKLEGYIPKDKRKKIILLSDDMRMNSGIAKVDEDENHYYFHGFSGSCYRCDKNAYGGGTSYTRSILENIFEYNRNNQSHWKTEMELMDGKTDWLNLIK